MYALFGKNGPTISVIACCNGEERFVSPICIFKGVLVLVTKAIADVVNKRPRAPAEILTKQKEKCAKK